MNKDDLADLRKYYNGKKKFPRIWYKEVKELSDKNDIKLFYQIYEKGYLGKWYMLVTNSNEKFIVKHDSNDVNTAFMMQDFLKENNVCRIESGLLLENNKLENKIHGLLIKPNYDPEIITFSNTLEELQGLVGGLIEVTYLPNDESVCIICNEEGKVLNLPKNRDIGKDIICGDFLVVGNDSKNGDFISLTDLQIQKYFYYFDKRIEPVMNSINSKENEKMQNTKSNDRDL